MKVLFVGLGSIGQRHLRNLLVLLPERPEFLALRRSRSVPLLTQEMTLDMSGKTVAEKYNLREYETIEAALAENPNLAIIANPSGMHVGDALAVAEAGVNLFIEKPLSDRWHGVPELLKLLEHSPNLIAMTGYQFRFHPALKKIKTMLEAGQIGVVVSARFINGEYIPFWHPYEDYRQGYAARKNLGGGALVNQIHDFDLAFWFFGLPVTVYAVGGKLSRLEVDVEDSVISLLTYRDNGHIFPVTIALDYLQYPSERSITIIGDSGKITWSFHTGVLSVSNINEKRIETLDYSTFDRNEMFMDQTRYLLDLLAGRVTRPVVSVNDASLSLKMALVARESMESGVPIDFDRYAPQ